MLSDIEMPAQRLVDRHSLQILKMENASVSVLPPNNSNHRLVAEDYLDSGNTASRNGMIHSNSSGDMVDSSDTINGGTTTRRKMTKTEKITVGVLCFVNLINYMDRFTIAGK